MNLRNKTIVFGVTGGIACYKAVETVSALVKQGAIVRVIMTEHAKHFVSETTFRTISQNQVASGMFDEPGQWDTEHISLAQAADVFVIAPATANIIGKMAAGIADDFLSTVALATKAHILIVPAMNDAMYKNPIVQRNIRILQENGMRFVTPEKGRLACGDEGMGRYPKTESIIEAIGSMTIEPSYKNIPILITAGPTREPLDPVRHLSNASTGKMGIAFAKAARDLGAAVTLVLGPTSQEPPTGIRTIHVRTAVDMLNVVQEHKENNRILAFFAAVSDYRPADTYQKKMEKQGVDPVIHLVKNPDIAMITAEDKKDRIHIGACAQTHDMIRFAQKKLIAKKFDLIMANDISMKDAGFGTDTNIVTLIDTTGHIEELPKMSKYEVSLRILQRTAQIFNIGEE